MLGRLGEVFMMAYRDLGRFRIKTGFGGGVFSCRGPVGYFLLAS